MDTNPYASSNTAARRQVSKGRFQWLFTIVKRLPATCLLLSAACLISTSFAIREYQFDQEGAAVRTQWDHLLDKLSMPGVFCAYVVGVITNSYIATFVAGFAGMFFTYGMGGVALDLLLADVHAALAHRQGGKKDRIKGQRHERRLSSTLASAAWSDLAGHWIDRDDSGLA